MSNYYYGESKTADRSEDLAGAAIKRHMNRLNVFLGVAPIRVHVAEGWTTLSTDGGREEGDLDLTIYHHDVEQIRSLAKAILDCVEQIDEWMASDDAMARNREGSAGTGLQY